MDNVLSENRKAYFNYEIMDKFSAGMVLFGHEVKSIRTGKMSLVGSYVTLRNNEAYLTGANIHPYQPKNITEGYNPKRDRRLLLRKNEINELIGKTEQKGLTLAPLKVYTVKGLIKLEFAIAKGKKKADKRESIKKREADREIRRAFKNSVIS
ncbi:MAG: SsrA-binding protein [Candidatus Nealsonbacteria bacterium CG_4_8_14_3_um_filter_39_7]|uniref:SsrA-binding protein n=1 Tax=Candidatus Nealsonbacteria bacterium CG23_combo_of_CG06-09_8_20_14_all_39_17 TaxID=1974722 RepID=A0A2G9YV55_9BACT|nr:MAG: SsrA-binding protein [Candidatus Nealsonbacteria bacterium CG23_combo_of_CG06-09_8_20_14_all_39_17]PIW90984.1 MAG: SsrA-binding protein [Candidatus Nealsonbacteria bacterium CG_4_8_14_3_um_filter_39_7]